PLGQRPQLPPWQPPGKTPLGLALLRLRPGSGRQLHQLQLSKSAEALRILVRALRGEFLVLADREQPDAQSYSRVTGASDQRPSRSYQARSSWWKTCTTTSPKSSSTQRLPRAPSDPIIRCPAPRKDVSTPSATASSCRSLVPEQITRKSA